MNYMNIQKRAIVDRRQTEDRRHGYDIAVVNKLGMERRKNNQRLMKTERRSTWVRVAKWQSVKLSEIVGNA